MHEQATLRFGHLEYLQGLSNISYSTRTSISDPQPLPILKLSINCCPSIMESTSLLAKLRSVRTECFADCADIGYHDCKRYQCAYWPELYWLLSWICMFIFNYCKNWKQFDVIRCKNNYLFHLPQQSKAQWVKSLTPTEGDSTRPKNFDIVLAFYKVGFAHIHNNQNLLEYFSVRWILT